MSSQQLARLRCYVLMPFSPESNFVYEYGIKSTLTSLATHFDISVDHSRADETLAMQGEKLPEIIDAITRSDFLIIDITGRNPNVLWELGFCQALQKHAIILTQSMDDLAFNYRGLDVHRYEFSPSGLQSMSKELPEKLQQPLRDLLSYKSTLRFDEDFASMTATVHGALGRIRGDSLLKNLARNEIRRLYGRIKKLREGTFELRSARPNQETADYFCDYMSQLNDAYSRFCTVTQRRFWDAITDGGEDFKYLGTNIAAARKGATIQRIFLIDGNKYPQGNVSNDRLFRTILGHHFRDAKSVCEAVKTRVFVTRDYEAACRTYENFGVLTKASQRLLFRPEYNHDDTLNRTLFTYSDANDDRNSRSRENARLIDRYLEMFDTVWELGTPLSEEHFARREARTI